MSTPQREVTWDFPQLTTGLEEVPYPQREFLLAARAAAAAIKPSPSDIAALAGPQIAEELHRCA